MGTIIVTEYVSLDGVMEAPGGGDNYEHAGWAFETDGGDEGPSTSSPQRFRTPSETTRPY